MIGTAVAVTDNGIYYVPCSTASHPGETTAVRMLDPRTGKDREVARLEQYRVGLLTAGFAVSPDGKTILYSPDGQFRGRPHDDRELPVTDEPNAPPFFASSSAALLSFLLDFSSHSSPQKHARWIH